MGRSSRRSNPDSSNDSKSLDTTDIDKWDNSLTTVAEYSRDLAEWLPKQDSRYVPMCEYGYAFIKDKTVCYNDNHIDSVTYGFFNRDTLTDPASIDASTFDAAVAAHVTTHGRHPDHTQFVVNARLLDNIKSDMFLSVIETNADSGTRRALEKSLKRDGVA